MAEKTQKLNWLRRVHLQRTECVDLELHGHSQRSSICWKGEDSQPDDSQPWLNPYLYPQKQIPVACVLEIFVCLSHTSLSFPASFTDTVSLLWNPTESFPCYLSASTWERSPHLEFLANACRPTSLRCVGRSALCCTRLQSDQIAGFQSKCL